MTKFGCLYLLLITIIFLPVYLVLFAMSAPTTILFTILAAAILSYTWHDWKHLFVDSSESSNSYTKRRNTEIPVRAEVEVITRMFLGNPDLDCKDTKGNGLTIQESIDIHYKRLNKYGRSKLNKEMEYMGPRGGVYTYTSGGNRNYR